MPKNPCGEVVCLLTDVVAPAPRVSEPASAAPTSPEDIDKQIDVMLPSLEELPLDSVEHEEAAPIPMRREITPAR